MEPFRRHNCDDDEKYQNDELSNQKRRLGLLRSQRVQRRNLQEGLHDRNKNIQVEGSHSADHVDTTPGAGEMKGIACQDRNRQHDQRNDADSMRQWKKAPRRAREQASD